MGLECCIQRCCETCGEPLIRRVGMSQRDWMARRFCNQECRNNSPQAAKDARAAGRPVFAVQPVDPLAMRMLAFYAKVARERHITIEAAAMQLLNPQG